MKLSVFFNGQFWVGLIERNITGKYFSTIHVFGEEPKEGDILNFIKTKLIAVFNHQTEFIETEEVVAKRINPKRLKKLAAKEMKKCPVSTRSQEAMQKQLESNKQDKKKKSKILKEEQKEYVRQKKVEKKKEKHKGH